MILQELIESQRQQLEVGDPNDNLIQELSSRTGWVVKPHNINHQRGWRILVDTTVFLYLQDSGNLLVKYNDEWNEVSQGIFTIDQLISEIEQEAAVVMYNKRER